MAIKLKEELNDRTFFSYPFDIVQKNTTLEKAVLTLAPWETQFQ
jgi:hypothetical protein